MFRYRIGAIACGIGVVLVGALGSAPAAASSGGNSGRILVRTGHGAPPAPQATALKSLPAAAKLLVISGPTGGQVRFRLTHTAHLNNAGYDVDFSQITGPIRGIVIRRTDQRLKVYDMFEQMGLTDSFTCGHPGCPYERFMTEHVLGTNEPGNGTFVLYPGAYEATLVGAPGQNLTATVHLRSEPVSRTRLAARASHNLAYTQHPDQVSVAGNDLVGRGYTLHYDATHEEADGQILILTTANPGLATIAQCIDIGDGPATSFTSLCAGGGMPFSQPQPYPRASPVTKDGPPLFAAIYGQGPAGTHGGYGYDIDAVSAGSRLVAIDFEVTFD